MNSGTTIDTSVQSSIHRVNSRRDCAESIMSCLAICTIGMYGFSRGEETVGWILLGVASAVAATALRMATRKILVNDTVITEYGLLRGRSILLSEIKTVQVTRLRFITERPAIVSVTGAGKRIHFTSATEGYTALLQHLRAKAVNAEFKGVT